MYFNVNKSIYSSIAYTHCDGFYFEGGHGKLERPIDDGRKDPKRLHLSRFTSRSYDMRRYGAGRTNSNHAYVDRSVLYTDRDISTRVCLATIAILGVPLRQQAARSPHGETGAHGENARTAGRRHAWSSLRKTETASTGTGRSSREASDRACDRVSTTRTWAENHRVARTNRRPPPPARACVLMGKEFYGAAQWLDETQCTARPGRSSRRGEWRCRPQMNP